jgi:hypothetical protein
MAWEERGGHHYYYRKRRVAGAIINEYVGRGLLGDTASNIDEQEREQRRQQRLQDARFKQELSRLDQTVDDYHDAVRQAVTVGLQQLGYRQHKRMWRKARTMANEVAAQAGKANFDEYNKLLAAAGVKKPKATDLERLRQYGIDHPAIFEQSSMMGQGTIHDVIDATSTSEATKVHMKGEVRELVRSLGYAKATALERLLIQNIALCWLRTNMMEQTYTHHAMGGAGISMATAEYLERRLSCTQRRYLRAVESLARVRGLLARAGVQINVASQQVVMNG